MKLNHRRWLVPEVVQTSAMDCGPAALKCLLEGFGIPVSYGRLREACQTDVDGTSIDTMEEIAVQLGLEAEQIMVPPDYLLLEETKALPAIAVVELPTGMTHFVLLWRKTWATCASDGPSRREALVQARAFAVDFAFTHPACSSSRLEGVGHIGKIPQAASQEAVRLGMRQQLKPPV